MTRDSRVRDPRKIPVQLNTQIPWEFREFLIETASKRRMSLAQLVRTTLEDAFAEDPHEATKRAGSTR